MKHLSDGSVANVGDIVVVHGYAGGNAIGSLTTIKAIEGKDVPESMVVCHLAYSHFGSEVYEFCDQLSLATDEQILNYSEGRII